MGISSINTATGNKTMGMWECCGCPCQQMCSLNSSPCQYVRELDTPSRQPKLERYVSVYSQMVGTTDRVCRFFVYVSGTPGSSVGIATDYWLDGPGSHPGGDEIFRPSRPALGPTQPPVKWVNGSFPRVKCGRGVLLTTHPLLVPRSWKSKAIPLLTLWAKPGLQLNHFTFI